MANSDPSRRAFLGGVALAPTATLAGASGGSGAQAGVAGGVSVRVADGRVSVETPALLATLERGFITSLRSRATGEELLDTFDTSASAALQIVYPGSETVRVDASKFGSVTARQVSPARAEFVCHGWDGDGVISVSADPGNGDLVIEPAGYSSRPGVQACRWSVRGVRKGDALVAPLFQGVRLPLDDALVRDTRWPWPSAWEAGLAIVQSRQGGFWVHCRDDRYRYKALKVDSGALGFDTEAYGPLDSNLSAGGLAWRVNVFQGDWRSPAASYRDWLWGAYGLAGRESRRAAWMKDVAFALSWCPGDPGILDAVAKIVDPRRVLIHFPDWRTDPYDENYPTFRASDKARAFLEQGRRMGFHIMPHCNAVDMDPTHPVYAEIRDFEYRDLEKKRHLGWSWLDGRVLGVPESNRDRTGHRDKKVMVKVHPGLSRWRSILAENVGAAARDLRLENVFLDVTLTTYNLHNSLVENTTSTEGMKRLIDEVAELEGGLVVGGEGRNEITAQSLSFAQAHLFRSWQQNTPGVERSGGCALNAFLFDRLCRTFGYTGLGGRNADEELRMRLDEEHGTIPTLTIQGARELTEPNPAVRRLLDRVRASA